jgi:hypothetical protein
VPSSTGRSARLSFILETRGPRGALRHVKMPEPTSTEMRRPEP